MRIRNSWFEISSFLAGVVMLLIAIGSIVGFRRGDGLGDLRDMAVGGVFVLLAVLFFWTSLRVGRTQNKRRQLRDTKVLD